MKELSFLILVVFQIKYTLLDSPMKELSFLTLVVFQ